MHPHIPEPPIGGIATADNKVVFRGDRVFNYYDMKWVIIIEDPDKEGWFRTQTCGSGNGPLLNGERICTAEFALGQFKAARELSQDNNLRKD
jgi:hypothetical protein